MEKYKQVEKDSKHKAYSKEGLTQPEQLSPAEQQKQDTIEYVNKTLDELQIQLEALEADSAKLISTGKKSKKGGLSAKDQERKQELDEAMDMVRYHQQNLELVLRLVQNGKLEADALDPLKDDISYFLESNRDLDFIYDDLLYESLGLDQRDNVLAHDVKTSFDAVSAPPEEETPPPAHPAPSATQQATKARTASPPVPKAVSPAPLKSPKKVPIPLSTAQLKPAPVPAKGERKWAEAARASTTITKKSLSATEHALEFDVAVATLAPGLQAFLESAVRAQCGKVSPITCPRDLLHTPRQPVLQSQVIHPTEYARYCAEWDVFRSALPCDLDQAMDTVLAKAAPLLLFFGYYYGVLLAERRLCKRGLFLKNWMLYNNGLVWFLKVGPSTASGDGYEISNYEVFDVMNWSGKMLANYRLDLSQLAEVDI